MKKRIIPMICLMIVATFLAVTSLNNIYAVGETKNITFEDENMYNAIKEKLPNKISSSDDATKTITMTQENIDSVKKLDIRDNTIINISGIENFTNLSELTLDGLGSASNLLGKISDISVLSKLTNLTFLSLSCNQISDISVLSELTNLTSLDLACNPQISDINVLEKLTKLTSLELGGYSSSMSGDKIISNGKISNIKVLSNLKNLTSLKISCSQINDISALLELTNLTSLDLRGNQINDIGILSKLTKLTSLNLSFNQISDISVLPKLTNLTSLDISCNQINDPSILDNELENVSFLIDYQFLSINNDKKIVELPKIFLQAKDESSRLYTSADYILQNCTLSEDGKSVIVNDDVTSANVIISGGKADHTRFQISVVESLSLNLSVSKTKEELTNQNVGVTITANKTLNQLEGWTLSDDKMSLTKEYEQNITESIKVTAEDGSISTADISITNIDKEPPVVGYSTKENEDGSLDVMLKANEKVRPVDGWILSEDAMTLTKTYTDPTVEELKIYDIAGNETDCSIEIKFKDNNLEVEEVKTEEFKENPKTGDMMLYVGLAMLSACAILVISTVHIKKTDK